jgi:hypothetical protein
MFEKLVCLERKESQSVLSEIHSLRSHWVARMGESLPFFTLGSASYLDSGFDSDFGYKKKVKRTNPLLKEHFLWLYQKIQETLMAYTGQKVLFDETLAYPGFHIFEYSPYFKEAVASVHFDLQFESISWDSYQKIEKDKTLSFTLPITLPKAGGGLLYWNLSYEIGKEMSDDEIDAYTTKTAANYIPYEIGKLVVHKGQILHQIAPAKNMEPKDERITLQGHALFCDGAYRIYW